LGWGWRAAPVLRLTINCGVRGREEAYSRAANGRSYARILTDIVGPSTQRAPS
jgi:hypothetical protein